VSTPQLLLLSRWMAPVLQPKVSSFFDVQSASAARTAFLRLSPLASYVKFEGGCLGFH